MPLGKQHFGCSRREVDGLPPQAPAPGLGEGEERREQPFLALAGDDDPLAHLAERGAVRVQVSERDLRKGALEGDLATQLMSGVGEEVLARVESGRWASGICSESPGERHRGTAITRMKDAGIRRTHRPLLPPMAGWRFVMRQAHQRNLNGTPLRLRGRLELA